MYSDLTLVGTYGFIKYLNGFQKIQGNAVFCIAIVDAIIIVILSIFFMDKLILDVPDRLVHWLGKDSELCILFFQVFSLSHFN